MPKRSYNGEGYSRVGHNYGPRKTHNKNIGRNWLKGYTAPRAHKQTNEMERRRRQIAAGKLKPENGLTGPVRGLVIGRPDDHSRDRESDHSDNAV